jgi:para-aminobenzoate synthetase component I
MQNIDIQEIPYQPNSDALFQAVRDLPDAIWLDSGKPGSTQGRFDIISACPDAHIETRGAVSTITDSSGTTTSDRDPFELAEQLLQPLLPLDSAASNYPFVGGLIGYFGYDLGRRLIDIDNRATAVTNLPDMRIGRFLWALIVDHSARQCQLLFHNNCPAQLRADILQRFTEKSLPAPSKSLFTLGGKFTATLDQNQYQQAIQHIKSYIAAGDCYQTNFAQHFSARFKGDLWTAYKGLREKLPSPYSAFWQWPDQALLCLSPERFIQSVDGAVETKPIKGTVKRGATVAEDRQLSQQLINSSKDRAENLMIVDLLRNDLSKNCESGSIAVPKLFELESFANVHHLVSTVTGKLEENSTPLSLLRDSFPGGSITGAPKKRAMEIIEELEPVRRSAYCGSIGYISANNRMDSNIAIRTVIADGDQLHCWGGGGIVADSQEQREYQESIDKISALLSALETFIPDSSC